MLPVGSIAAQEVRQSGPPPGIAQGSPGAPAGWTITPFTSLKRLVGPAADSPLNRERGQRMQATLGPGYGIRFGL